MVEKRAVPHSQRAIVFKLFAERRLGVLGSKFRTRLVVGSLLLSFIPVIVMFWFSYGLMNRSIERWFSSPVEEVQQDTALMATLLSRYASENAHAEAVAIAALPETQRAFQGHSFSGVLEAFRARDSTPRRSESDGCRHWPIETPRTMRPSSCGKAG